MVNRTILCVAEKGSIARAVVGHLGGPGIQAQNVPGSQYTKNYTFDYVFSSSMGQCRVIFTSVAGHVMSHDFPSQYRNWQSCDPGALFEADIKRQVAENNIPIANNIKLHANRCSMLFIWTDCDREGENIGAEIRDLAREANPRLQVKRAHFSNVERAHIIQAANNPVDLDDRQAKAVDARIELDLRVGAAFTRVLTLNLTPMIKPIQDDLKVISYGSCQFPTLGFVVDRYFRVRNFVKEPFWSIKVTHKKNDITVPFNWNRNHLFDRMTVVILFERCLVAKTAKVVKMQKRPTSKWRPLPLTTVELQKMGSRFLRMNSHEVMKIAEDLYTKGWISYPRTETDQFDHGMDLRALVQKQDQGSAQWGPFAHQLLNGGFQWPKSGRHNDKAHPPIHPVNYVVNTQLNDAERRVYEFVVRRFLACCSEDAKGELTQAEIEYGSEIFKASGLMILQRNYLDVYPYDKWENSQQLPEFTLGETFIPKEAKITQGQTSPPGYLTEPELISLMDANGIGTDATMAEHINKIKERNYVQARTRAGQATTVAGNDSGPSRGRGGRGGRGRGRGRGGSGTGNASSTGPGGGMDEFIPTNLGVALIKGYESLEFETSLSKPFLRKEMELQMKAICEGRSTKSQVVQQSLEQYREVYVRTRQQMEVLKDAVRQYVLGQGTG